MMKKEQIWLRSELKNVFINNNAPTMEPCNTISVSIRTILPFGCIKTNQGHTQGAKLFFLRIFLTVFFKILNISHLKL